MKAPHFEKAMAAANECVEDMVAAGIPADDIADAMITKSLAIWAAFSGREENAKAWLARWTKLRDAH